MITLSPLVIVLAAVSALMLLLLILNYKNAQRQAEQAEAEWEKERLYLERQFAQQHDELQRHLRRLKLYSSANSNAAKLSKSWFVSKPCVSLHSNICKM